MGRWPGEGGSKPSRGISLCSQGFKPGWPWGSQGLHWSRCALRKDEERPLGTSPFVVQCPRALRKQASEPVLLFTTGFPWALGTDSWVPGNGKQGVQTTCPQQGGPSLLQDSTWPEGWWTSSLRVGPHRMPSPGLHWAGGCQCPLWWQCCPLSIQSLIRLCST